MFGMKLGPVVAPCVDIIPTEFQICTIAFVEVVQNFVTTCQQANVRHTSGATETLVMTVYCTPANSYRPRGDGRYTTVFLCDEQLC